VVGALYVVNRVQSWVLNLADGQHSLLAIAERSGLPFREVAAAARVLSDHGLLSEQM
jgi:aminopeptidase-like protein